MSKNHKESNEESVEPSASSNADGRNKKEETGYRRISNDFYPEPHQNDTLHSNKVLTPTVSSSITQKDAETMLESCCGNSGNWILLDSNSTEGLQYASANDQNKCSDLPKFEDQQPIESDVVNSKSSSNTSEKRHDDNMQNSNNEDSLPGSAIYNNSNQISDDETLKINSENSTNSVEKNISSDNMSTFTDNNNHVLHLDNMNNMSGASTSASDSVTSEVTTGNVYNILLLGETGVGKSTFLNAFMNYIHYSSLEEALNSEEIHALIPTRFTITDGDFNTHDIVFGEPDSNEALIPGEASTQACKSYMFKFGNISLRFVDTPGVADTKGIEKDEEHLVNLIDYLAELKIDSVNAIMLLLKPNESKLTVLFQYCVKRLLSCLERSATQNIIFLFTNCRGTFYRPGDIVQPLRKILDDIANSPPYVRVPFRSTNSFCVDNEAFRYLAARRKGCPFDEDMKYDFAESWEKSATTCDRLLNYITSLEAHLIKGSVTVMEARMTIEKLRWPLGKTIEHIEQSIRRITQIQTDISRTDARISELAKDLIFTRVKLNIRKLEEPRTVCTNQACIELKSMNEYIAVHYKTICHQPCTLKGVSKECIGVDLLKNCWAMENGICRRCRHSYLEHQHIYFETEPYIDTIIDIQTQDDIHDKESEREIIEESLTKLKQEKQELEKEKSTILKAMAKFAHFLQNNAIVSHNDSFEMYVEKLIEREKTNQNVVVNYKMLIKAYREEVNILRKELEELRKEDSRVATIVTAPEVMGVIDMLYGLTITGRYIKEMYEAGRDHDASITAKQHEEQIISVCPTMDKSGKKDSRYSWLFRMIPNKIKKTLGYNNVEVGEEAMAQSTSDESYLF